MASLTTFVLSLSLFAACTPDGRTPAGDDDGSGSGSAQPDPGFYASSQVGAIAADADRVYFTEGLAVKSIAAADGSDPQTLYTLPAGDSSTGSYTSIAQFVVGPSDLAWVESTFDATTGAQMSALRAIPKTGGSPRTLATDADSRAFLGVSFAGDWIYYSSNTAVLRVPRAGGSVEYVGESDQSVQYWIFSPTVVDDTLYWAADDEIYRLAVGDREGRGAPIGTVPGASGMIVDATAGKPFVVALSPEIDFQDSAMGFVELDPATGQSSALRSLQVGDGRVMAVVATATDVFAATLGGVVRAPRDGSASATQVTTAPGLYIAANATHAYASSQTGITKL